jgi:hypothetical protein
MLSGEATNTNFIVFGLTRTGLEPTIYHSRVEHANLYTTDAVNCLLDSGAVPTMWYLIFGFSIYFPHLSVTTCIHIYVYISHVCLRIRTPFVLFLLTCGSLYYSFSEEKIVFVKLWCLLVSSTYIMYLRNFLCCTHINALIQLAALSINDIFRQSVLLQSIYSL